MEVRSNSFPPTTLASLPSRLTRRVLSIPSFLQVREASHRKPGGQARRNVQVRRNEVSTHGFCCAPGPFHRNQAAAKGKPRTFDDPLPLGCVSLTLYFVWQLAWLCAATAQDLLTVCLSLYFVLLGTFAIAATVLPFVGACLPHFVRTARVKLGFLDKLPGPLKGFFFESDSESGELDLGNLEITGSELFCGLGSAVFCYWYFTSKHWVSNNGKVSLPSTLLTRLLRPRWLLPVKLGLN